MNRVLRNRVYVRGLAPTESDTSHGDLPGRTAETGHVTNDISSRAHSASSTNEEEGLGNPLHQVKAGLIVGE